VQLNLDHIGILTRSLLHTVRDLPQECIRHEIQAQPAEGTMEQYVTMPHEGSPFLLLIEAIDDGPYKRALGKRGPGLHHLGCVTNNLNDAIQYFTRFGLLLHPVSRKLDSQRTAWLCRRGIPFLVELYQSDHLADPPFQNIKLELPSPLMEKKTIDFIPGIELSYSIAERLRLRLPGNCIDISIRTEKGSTPGFKMHL